jgi:hypothetical protein
MFYLSENFSRLQYEFVRSDVNLQLAFGTALAQNPTTLLFFTQMAREDSDIDPCRVVFFNPNPSAIAAIPGETLFYLLVNQLSNVLGSRGACSAEVYNGILATVAFYLLSLCWREVTGSVSVLRRHGAFLGSGAAWLSVVERALGGNPAANGFMRLIHTSTGVLFCVVPHRFSQRPDREIWQDFCLAFEAYVRERQLNVTRLSPDEFIAELHVFYMANAYNFGLPPNVQGAIDFLIGENDRASGLHAELRQKVMPLPSALPEDYTNNFYGNIYPQVKVALTETYVKVVSAIGRNIPNTFWNFFEGSTVTQQPYAILGEVRMVTLYMERCTLCFLNENFPDFPFAQNSFYGAMYSAFRERFVAAFAALSSVGPEAAVSLENSIAMVFGSFLISICIQDDSFIKQMAADRVGNWRDSSRYVVLCHHEYLRRLEAVLSVRPLSPIALPYVPMTILVTTIDTEMEWIEFSRNFLETVLIERGRTYGFRENPLLALIEFYSLFARRVQHRNVTIAEGLEFLFHNGRFFELVRRINLLLLDQAEAGGRFSHDRLNPFTLAGAAAPVVDLQRPTKVTASLPLSLSDPATSTSFGYATPPVASPAVLPVSERPPNYRAGKAVHAGTFQLGNLTFHLWDRGARGDCLFSVVAGQDPSLVCDSDNATLCRLKLYSQGIMDIVSKLETLSREHYAGDATINVRIEKMIAKLKEVRNFSSYDQTLRNAPELERFIGRVSEEILWYELAQGQLASGVSDTRQAAEDLMRRIANAPIGDAAIHDGGLRIARDTFILRMAISRFATFPSLAESAGVPLLGRLFNESGHKNPFFEHLNLALRECSPKNIEKLCAIGYLMDYCLLCNYLGAAAGPENPHQNALRRVFATMQYDVESHSTEDRVQVLQSIARAVRVPLPWVGFRDLAQEHGTPFAMRLFSAGEEIRLQACGRVFEERMLTRGRWRNDSSTGLGRIMWHLVHSVLPKGAWCGDYEHTTICRATGQIVVFMSAGESHLQLAVPLSDGGVSVFVLSPMKSREDPNSELSNAPWSASKLNELEAACAACGYMSPNNAFAGISSELFTADGGGGRRVWSYQELLENLEGDVDIFNAVMEKNQVRISSTIAGLIRHISERGNGIFCFNSGGHWVQAALRSE